MSETLPVYVFSNGEVAKKVFEAIATFLGGNDFADMLVISSMIALGMTGMRYFLSFDHQHIFKWLMTYLMVPLFLINTKTDIQIIDATNPMAVYNVRNVPVGVSFPAYIGSEYMYKVTTAIESIFHTPTDSQYSQTGMLFGSTLYKLSSQPGVAEAELKEYWSQYLRNCIYMDIKLNGKYTWDELQSSTDIWTFLARENPSPLRRIRMPINGENYPTCRQALPVLKKQFESEAGKHLLTLGKVLYGEQANTQSQAFLQTALQNSASQYLGISKTASQIMLQNMTINAIRNGLADNAARVNASAAAMNYAYTQNRMQSTSMWASMGLQAKEYLPMIQSVLFLVFCSISILVLALAMLPGLLNVFFLHVKGFIHLGTWPVLFAFLNYIMTATLESNSTGLADLYGGLTLSNINAVNEMHQRYAALTGFLMMSIPFITHAVVKGAGAAMGSLANQVSSVIGSVNGRTSAAMASGDISQGNTQYDNHSWNNMNANKMDISALEKQFGYSLQNPDGTMTTSLPGGQRVFNSAGAISSTDFQINSNQTQTRALRQASADAHSAAVSSRTNLSQSVAHMEDRLFQFTEDGGKSFSYGSGTSDRDAATVREASSEISSLVDDFSKKYGVSKEEAFSNLFSIYASGSLGWDSKGSLFGSVVQKATGANAKGEVGAKGDFSWTDTDRTSSSTSAGNSASEQIQFNRAMDTLRDLSTSETTNSSNNQSTRDLRSIGESFRQTEDLAQTASGDESRSRSLNTALEASEQNTLGFNENLMPQFQEYLENRVDRYGKNITPYEVESIMYGRTDEDRINRDGYFRQFMTERYENYDASMNDQLNSMVMPNDHDISDFNRDSVKGLTINGEQEGSRDQFIEKKQKALDNVSTASENRRQNLFNEDHYTGTLDSHVHSKDGVKEEFKEEKQDVVKAHQTVMEQREKSLEPQENNNLDQQSKEEKNATTASPFPSRR